jgi:hypothetical protein
VIIKDFDFHHSFTSAVAKQPFVFITVAGGEVEAGGSQKKAGNNEEGETHRFSIK